MNTIRPATLNTRCHDALAQALSDATVFNILYPAGEIAVFTFNGAGEAGVHDITGGFVAPVAAIAAIAALPDDDCAGNTPLADAICIGVEQLLECAGADYYELAISSDGLENSSDGVCDGPEDASGVPPYDFGSWQAHAYQAIEGSGIVVNVRHWDAFNPSPVTGSNDPEETAAFYMALTAVSGGLYTPIDDEDPLPLPIGACCLPDGTCQESVLVAECINILGGEWAGEGSTCADCCPADLDGNGTVGVEDLLALLANWNGIGEGDINGDGTVDVADLLLLLAGWGDC
jgi:hypothetical protein